MGKGKPCGVFDTEEYAHNKLDKFQSLTPVEGYFYQFVIAVTQGQHGRDNF
jgi:hypothetical protein